MAAARSLATALCGARFASDLLQPGYTRRDTTLLTPSGTTAPGGLLPFRGDAERPASNEVDSSPSRGLVRKL
jgi:hypothetical protein